MILLWDVIPDCTGWETPQETDAILLPTKWNKDTEGAWRMDFAVNIEDIHDDGGDKDEINKSDSLAEAGDSESDSKSESSMSNSSD